MARNLGQLRLAARQRSDMENSQFVTDAEFNDYINQSLTELYDLLVSRFEDYFLAIDPNTGDTPQFVIEGRGANYINLPPNFYKLRGVDVSAGSQWISVSRFNFEERNKSQAAGSSGGVKYRMMGGRVYFIPPELAQGTYKLWYVPKVTPLIEDTDEPSEIMDFDEFLVLGAAKRALIKEESDTSAIENDEQKIRQRILAMASNRDASGPERILDIGHTF